MVDTGSVVGGTLPFFVARSVERASTSERSLAPQPIVRQHAVSFHGSGSEYFRIWIVNLLLTLLTLGLYHPWAKVRRLRYFHTHTQVAGHAFDFHGQPRQMLRGTLLVGLMLGAYSLAGHFSPLAQGVALLLLAGLWPALWRASMQFRLANTSWRGMRFRFTATAPEAYWVMAPAFLALVAVGGAFAAVPDAAPSAAAMALPLLLLGALYFCLPYLWLRLKRYQHGHYAYGQQQTRLKTTVGAAYGVFLRIVGVALLATLGLGGLVVLVLWAFGAGADAGAWQGALMAAAPLLFLLLLVTQTVPRAYATSRLQNLLWSRTGNADLRFRSELGFAPLARLLLKNWLLVMLTLGFYWPWAAVAVARLRLQAVSLRSRDSLDALVAGATAARGDAAGDAAGDALGIDLGL